MPADRIPLPTYPFERKRYWILKLLKKRRGKHLEALVLDRKYRNCRLLLTDYLLETSLTSPEGGTVRPGDTVSVIIEHVDPFSGVLKLRLD